MRILQNINDRRGRTDFCCAVCSFFAASLPQVSVFLSQAYHKFPLFTTNLPQICLFRRKFTASPLSTAKFDAFCCKFTTISPPFYHKSAANMLYSVVNLPQVCPFLPQVYLKFPFFHHKFTTNMSISVSKFVPFC